MLTSTDKRRLDICADRISDPNCTISNLAKKYDISPTSINNAIKWGRDHGFFSLDSGRKINEHILRLTRIRDHLQDEFMHALKKAKDKPKSKDKQDAKTQYIRDDTYNYQKNMVRLADKILDIETRIMALENLDIKLHLHLHTGEVQHKHVLSEDLQAELEKITGEKYNDGNGHERNVTPKYLKNDY